MFYNVGITNLRSCAAQRDDEVQTSSDARDEDRTNYAGQPDDVNPAAGCQKNAAGCRKNADADACLRGVAGQRSGCEGLNCCAFLVCVRSCSGAGLKHSNIYTNLLYTLYTNILQ